jgi:hypothetical protein
MESFAETTPELSVMGVTDGPWSFLQALRIKRVITAAHAVLRQIVNIESIFLKKLNLIK